MKRVPLSPTQARLLRELERLAAEAGCQTIGIRPHKLKVLASERSSVSDTLARLERYDIIKVSGWRGGGASRSMTVTLTGRATGEAATKSEIMTARRDQRLAAGGSTTPDGSRLTDTGAFTRRWLELGLPPRGYAFLSD